MPIDAKRIGFYSGHGGRVTFNASFRLRAHSWKVEITAPEEEVTCAYPRTLNPYETVGRDYVPTIPAAKVTVEAYWCDYEDPFGNDFELFAGATLSLQLYPSIDYVRYPVNVGMEAPQTDYFLFPQFLLTRVDFTTNVKQVVTYIVAGVSRNEFFYPSVTIRGY